MSSITGAVRASPRAMPEPLMFTVTCLLVLSPYGCSVPLYQGRCVLAAMCRRAGSPWGSEKPMDVENKFEYITGYDVKHY